MTESEKADALDRSNSVLHQKIEVLIVLAERTESAIQVYLDHTTLALKEERDQANLVVFQAYEVLEAVKSAEGVWYTMDLAP